jgi:type VI protein secretion system component VasF
MAANDRLAAVRKEAERIHESATYASETQFEYAKHWRRVDRWIGAGAAVLAAIAGVGGLSQVLSARWAGLIAVLAAGAGAVAASIGAPQTKEKASGSANAYRALQQDVRIFLTIDLESYGEEEARKRLQELVDRIQQLNAEADIPSFRAWQAAKGQIEEGAQTFEADK